MRMGLSRREPRDQMAELERHIASCQVGCREPRSTGRGRCAVGAALHERLVRAAHENPKDWIESVSLPDRGSIHHPARLLRLRLSIGGSTIEGIDTSIWQGAFPWNEAIAQGVGSGIAKASEGNGYTDPQWGRSVGWLVGQNQLVGGSYHFARPDLGNSAAAEADWYLSRHPALCFDPRTPWIFALDAESAGGSAAYCYEFLARVNQRVGYSCWFYSFANWISSRGVQAFNQPLWIAWPNPGDPPNLGWPAITQVQYGARSFSIGAVDANRFLGDVNVLLKLAGVSSSAPAADPFRTYAHALRGN